MCPNISDRDSQPHFTKKGPHTQQAFNNHK